MNSTSALSASVSDSSSSKDVSKIDRDELYRKINVFCLQEIGKFVKLKNEIIQYRHELNQQNRILNSKAWPKKEVLMQGLTEIDHKIAEFAQKLQPLNAIRQEFEDQIVAFKSPSHPPAPPETMSLYDMQGACDLEILSLKIDKYTADLDYSARQISALYREILMQLNWIRDHPREMCVQRIKRIEEGNVEATFWSSTIDQGRRHLSDLTKYLPDSFTGKKIGGDDKKTG